MPIFSGTAGGLQSASDNQALISAFGALIRGEAFDAFPQRARRTLPVSISMVVNNSCNLACRHCYLQVPELEGAALSEPEWHAWFDSVLSEPEIKLAGLVGKELFLGTKGPRLLKALADRNQALGSKAKRIGVITNGTLIAPHRDLIESCDLNYLDFSVDGTPDRHDAIRGKGAFSMLEPNLRWAAKAMPNQLFVSHTLLSENVQDLSATLHHLGTLGVQRVACGLFEDVEWADRALDYPGQMQDTFFERLHELTSESWESPMTVFFEIGARSPEWMAAFLRSPWFDFERVFADDSETLWIEHRFSNGLRIQFKLLPFPSGIWHSVRVTPEGHYLAADDIFHADSYRSVAVANIRDHGCDLARTQQAALSHPRLPEIARSFRPALPAKSHA